MFEAPPEEPEMKVAIVGRRNTGKSTFVNTLAKAERMIVSEIPGTTRDSVDVRFELDGKTFIAIDTAGVRRHQSIRSRHRFLQLPPGPAQHPPGRRRAAVLRLHAAAVSKVDKQLSKYIADQYKPCIFVVNKWDLLYGQMPTERWVDYLRDSFCHDVARADRLHHRPDGKEREGAAQPRPDAVQAEPGAASRRASSIELVQAALEKHPPPMHGMTRPKIYYATQVGVQPPTIVLMCNEPQGFSEQYRRFLLRVLRDNLKFGEVPIKMYLQRRRRDDKRNELGVEEDAARRSSRDG